MIDWLIFAALPVLQLIGCYAAVIYYLRAHAAQGGLRWFWLFLTSATGGGVGWTAQFVLLTKLHPGNLLYWNPQVLGATFAVAIFGLMIIFVTAERVLKMGHRMVSAMTFGVVYSAFFVLVTTALMVTAAAQGTVTFSLPHFYASTVALLTLATIGGGFILFGGTTMRIGIGALCLAISNPLVQYIVLSSTAVTIDASAAVPTGLSAVETEKVMLVAAALIVGVFGGTGLTMDQWLTARVSEELKVLVRTDALTQLPNRLGFQAELDRALEQVHENQKHLICLVLDLNKFKPINDLHGHYAGDALLRSIASRLRAVRQTGEVVARVGGDEFIAFKLVSPHADHQALLDEYAHRLRTAIVAPTTVKDTVLSVGVSVGVSLAPRHGTDAETLLGSADIALYQSKEAGGEVCIYTDQMGQMIRTRAETAQELERGLAEQEFRLHFQPQRNILTGELVGFEALIRWQHPTRGLLSPGAFIPIAEEARQIDQIGAWVLEEAARIAANWPKALHIAVNVAPRQLLQPGFVESVRQVLESSNLDPARLEIELTEASIIEDEETTRAVLKGLGALGVRLAMDDYGTGYASLSALRTFPFDKLKIDKSFVDELGKNGQSEAILQSTLLLAKGLDLTVLAEGVETQRQASFLRATGFEEVQGYFFGRPMSLQDTERLISEMPEQSHRMTA